MTGDRPGEPANVAPGPGDLENLRLIIVDDEPANVAILRRLLGRAGFENVVTTTDPRDVPRLCAEHPPARPRRCTTLERSPSRTPSY